METIITNIKYPTTMHLLDQMHSQPPSPRKNCRSAPFNLRHWWSKVT